MFFLLFQWRKPAHVLIRIMACNICIIRRFFVDVLWPEENMEKKINKKNYFLTQQFSISWMEFRGNPMFSYLVTSFAFKFLVNGEFPCTFRQVYLSYLFSLLPQTKLSLGNFLLELVCAPRDLLICLRFSFLPSIFSGLGTM